MSKLSTQSILIMFVAMSMIPAGDTAGKLLSWGLGAHPIYVSWSRFFIGTLMVLPFIPKGTWALLKDIRVWGRALLMATGLSCIQMALSLEPIADVFAAFFIGPLLSYVLAALFLREAISLQRSALIVAGFLGVLVVVRPGLEPSAGLLWALIAGKVQQLGNPLTLDIKELFGRVAEAIGKPKFGHADLPDAHRPTDTPQDYVKYLFPKVLPLLDRYGLAPEQYFLALALSAQEVMQMAKGTIAPDLAAIILMEYAVPASKLTAVPKPT